MAGFRTSEQTPFDICLLYTSGAFAQSIIVAGHYVVEVVEMLKYHVAVCDDEKSDLDGMVQSVQQYEVQGCFDIETYMDGNELLSELQMQKKSFDLLLLCLLYTSRCV